MQIETLKMFSDLAETKSFTKAARLSGVTQSAISQRLSALERQFQSLLVERGQKRWRLTTEGQALYDCSKEILRTSQALFGKLEEVKHAASRIIRLAAIYSFGLNELPKHTRDFQARHPNIDLRVTCRRAGQIYDGVDDGAIDLGLVAYPRRDSELEIIPLFQEPLVLICYPKHPFASVRAISLRDLSGQNFVTFALDSPTGKAIDILLKRAHARVITVMETEDVEAIKRAVEVEAGIAIVPASAVQMPTTRESLAVLKLDGSALARPLAIIHKKSRPLTPLMLQLVQSLKDESHEAHKTRRSAAN